MMSTYKERTGHFITHWGVPKEIHPRKPLAGCELAVMEFSPRRDGEKWRYATNGMSEQLQTADSVGVRTELVAYTLNHHGWVVDLLDALCRYPIQNATYFSEYDTVPIGQPIDRGVSKFSGVLLAPLPTGEPPSLPSMWGLFPEPVSLLTVIGIYDSECDIAAVEGGKHLFDLLDSIECVCLDTKREPISS